MFLASVISVSFLGAVSYSYAQNNPAAPSAPAAAAAQPQPAAQPTAQPNTVAAAAQPTAGAGNDAIKSPLLKGYELDNGYFIRQVGNRSFAKINREKEIELPRPQFAIDFQKFPNYKTDPNQRRALLAHTSERYVKEYESIYLQTRGIGIEYSPFKTILDYVLITIEQDPVDKLAADIFPPARLRRRLDETAINTDRSYFVNFVKDIAELKRKNSLLEQEINELKKKIK